MSRKPNVKIQYFFFIHIQVDVLFFTELCRWYAIHRRFSRICESIHLSFKMEGEIVNTFIPNSYPFVRKIPSRCNLVIVC